MAIFVTIIQMQMDNYRSSTDYREILRILQKASSLQENFLWQSHTSGRTVVPVHHFEIDFVSREVVLFYNAKHFPIDTSIPLYVKLDYRTSVFKVQEYRRAAAGTLTFSFPKELKTLELRGASRHDLKSGAEKYIYLRPGLSTKGGAPEIVVKAIDASPGGLGVVVSEANRSYLKNNRILWITKLQDRPLERPILAEVVYITSEQEGHQTRKNRELKVGLKLSGELSHDALSTFIS